MWTEDCGGQSVMQVKRQIINYGDNGVTVTFTVTNKHDSRSNFLDITLRLIEFYLPDEHVQIKPDAVFDISYFTQKDSAENLIYHNETTRERFEYNLWDFFARNYNKYYPGHSHLGTHMTTDVDYIIKFHYPRESIDARSVIFN
jgi:hypothetical protein